MFDASCRDCSRTEAGSVTTRAEKEQAALAVCIAEELDKARVAAGLKKKDLAKRLGCPPSRVTRVLSGKANMTLHTIAEFGLACGVRWTLKAEWEQAR